MDRRLSQMSAALWRGMKAVGMTAMVFVRRAAWSMRVIRYGRLDIGKIGDGSGNSIVEAVTGWIARNFPEAPVIVRALSEGEWQTVQGHPMTTLIERPTQMPDRTSVYSGVLLWTATILEFLWHANAYWLKVRNATGNVVQLWWVPQAMIEPKWNPDGSEFIGWYDYCPDGSTHYRLRREDVVHFRDGMDPDNIRKGRNRLSVALREVFTDEEASSYTAAILSNLGVPGVIISPANDNMSAKPEDVAARFKEKFGGDNRGEAMVLTGPTKVDRLSFSPQEMNLRDLRKIPEERISAIFGVPAIVAGLGAGLDRSTFANFAEARQAAYEECIIPIQRIIAAELEVQLLGDFEADTTALDVDWDLSDVRVLADDVDALWRRADLAVRGGWISVATAQKMVGLTPAPSDDVYLRALNILTVPAGEPVPAIAPSAPAPQLTGTAAPRQITGGTATMPMLTTTQAPVAVTKATHLRAVKARAPSTVLRARLAATLGGKTEDALRAIFERLARSILPQIKSRKAIEWTPEEFDWTPWQTEIRDVLVGMYGTVGEEVFRAIADETNDSSIAFDLSKRQIADRIGERVKGIMDTTRGELSDIVQKAVERGYTTRQLRDGVPADGFTGLVEKLQSWADVPGGEARAGLIARTELGFAYNWASTSAYEDAGVTQVQVFDGDGDEACAEANGQVWTLDEADANPLEHPNCQRTFAPIFGGEAAA